MTATDEFHNYDCGIAGGWPHSASAHKPRTMQEHFARWLVAEGLAEESRGYGHATGEEIAERVFTFFDLTFKEPNE